MDCKNCPACPEKGVALIEVMVSVLLLSIGLLGLLGLQARAIGFSTDAEDRNRAVLLANEISSAMWINRSVNLPAATVTSWQSKISNVADSGLPNATGTVTVVSSMTNTADVRISWRAPSRAKGDADSQLTTRVTINLP